MIWGKADSEFERGRAVRQISLLLSFAFLLAVPAGILFTGENNLITDFLRLITSPCPLITDYFLISSLPATFLNAALCGLACTIMLYCADLGKLNGSNWAGYFLVVGHCFYGLNFINMWPPVLGVLIYFRLRGLRFRDRLDVVMFSTAFGPFVSELMFRYPLFLNYPIHIGPHSVNAAGIAAALALGAFLGFTVPAILPGAKLLHRGFNLYNGGLAFGLIGLLVYSFLYKTMGVDAPQTRMVWDALYTSKLNRYFIFCNCFYIMLFVFCLLYGFLENGRTVKGYNKILKTSGLGNDYILEFEDSLSWINMGFYGLFIILYFDFVILTGGGTGGWTAPTCGVVLAAVTFASAGQHPKNVWPIMAGYAALFALISLVCLLTGKTPPWTLATQGYINGFAFATGLCPFAGCYGPFVGIIAGFIHAVLCTTTSVIHGGFVLYNGGLTAGLTALILTPMLAHYYRKKHDLIFKEANKDTKDNRNKK